MNVQSLLQILALDELTYEASALTAWETGIVSNAEDVAIFMYRGGPLPPQASAKDHLIKEDCRPERKYWTFVKKEIYAFLCTDDKRHKSIDDMRRLARDRGGKCLSEAYVNNRTKLTWACENGHVWEATPNHIKSGTWCPVCKGCVKLTIEEMRAMAGSRGGTCLSDVYVNANTRLKWRCEKGHIWEAIPNSIKRGSWCPECSRHQRLVIDCLQQGIPGGGRGLHWSI